MADTFVLTPGISLIPRMIAQWDPICQPLALRRFNHALAA
jgi:hypothetical protein